MNVEITDYNNKKYYIDYKITGLSKNQLEFLKNNLEEESCIIDNYLKIRMYFNNKIFPFNSETAKYKLNDYIANEEIQMNIYLSSILEDL